MATRFQHYVPQVYLRAWETTKGVYYFTKNNLSVGERRNTNSILAEYHTYTIDYEHSFVFNEMPEIATDFGNKIIEILNKQNALAFYKEKRLETIEELTSVEAFPFLEDWEFYKQDNPEFLARKNSIVREIKDIHSYVIENKLDDFLEKEWGKTRDEFIQAIEKVSGYTTMEDVKIDETLAIKMLYSVLLLMCRNPVFDCLGIFPKIENVFTDMFSINELCEEEKKKSKKVIDQQLHAAWLGKYIEDCFKIKRDFVKYTQNICKRDVN